MNSRNLRKRRPAEAPINAPGLSLRPAAIVGRKMRSLAKSEETVLPSNEALVDSLRERIRLLEAVVDNFPGGISLFDKNLRMVFCNEQQKQLLDYPQYLFASGYPMLEQIFRFNATR